MSDNRKQALEALRDKVAAGVKYETMGHTVMCQKAFPKPDDFDGSREAYANSPAQLAVLVWRNADLNAAKALHEAVLPRWRVSHAWGCGDSWTWNLTKSQTDKPIYAGATSDNPARAWLIAILEALISETPKGETP